MTRCFLLLVDGLRRDLAESELDAGTLPNLAAMVEEGGRSCAITAFPSTTSVAYLPFLTGCMPGRCDIPSIRLEFIWVAELYRLRSSPDGGAGLGPHFP